MARVRAIAVLVTVVMSIASCTRGADPGGDPALGETVVDTIGDTIVVRTVNARDDEAGLRLTPEITIGVVDGAEEYQFASVAEMVPAADGTAYVWDRTLGVLRQYDPSGRFVRVIGGQGGGPGEYRSSNGIALLPGGRLVLWDAQQARVNVYDTSGTHITTWRAASPAMGPRGVYVDTAGALYLRTPLREPRLPDAAGSQETGLIEVDAGTGTPIRFLRAPTSATSAPRIAVMRADGQPAMFRYVPFWPELRWSWSPHGYFVSAAGDRYAVTLQREQGAMRIERDVAPVPLVPNERANVEERVIASMRRVDPSWTWSGPRIPEHKPIVRAIVVGADGRIWVQRWLAGERLPESEVSASAASGVPPLLWREPVGFDVFEPDGHFVGFVFVPSRATILHSRGDQVWAVLLDSLDVPAVVRFRLTGPARR